MSIFLGDFLVIFGSLIIREREKDFKFCPRMSQKKYNKSHSILNHIQRGTYPSFKEETFMRTTFDFEHNKSWHR